jgi:hypothetical protein
MTVVMEDIAFVLVVVAFFGVAVALAAGCAWIVGGADGPGEAGRR